MVPESSPSPLLLDSNSKLSQKVISVHTNFHYTPYPIWPQFSHHPLLSHLLALPFLYLFPIHKSVSITHICLIVTLSLSPHILFLYVFSSCLSNTSFPPHFWDILLQWKHCFHNFWPSVPSFCIQNSPPFIPFMFALFLLPCLSMLLLHFYLISEYCHQLPLHVFVSIHALKKTCTSISNNPVYPRKWNPFISFIKTLLLPSCIF